MKISEMFLSLQGEGLYIGVPMYFVRTAGCNLRCAWCDTPYALTGGKEMSVKEVYSEIIKEGKRGIQWVCITGGEPLLQKDIYKLLYALLDSNFMVLFETNGSLPIDELPTEENLIVSMDIKTPSSKMHDKMNFKNIEVLGPTDYVKFVIADDRDYDYAKKIIREYEPYNIVMQPVGGVDLKWLAEKVIQDRLGNVRVLPQLHKIIWPEADRGR